MNLEEWTCAVKIAGSKKSKYLISKIINGHMEEKEGDSYF